MNIDEIIRAWKVDEELVENTILENPAGNELSEEELEQVAGGMPCTVTCGNTVTCIIQMQTCVQTD